LALPNGRRIIATWMAVVGAGILETAPMAVPLFAGDAFLISGNAAELSQFGNIVI